MSTPQKTTRRPFLTAAWRYLLMLNFEVRPELLLPFVPAETTLDMWNGRAFVSVVGFRFLNTRILGLPVPLHRNFDEVNLRFYVQHRSASGAVRRGVTFIREVVPRRAIARIAQWRYNEPYVCRPMRSVVPPTEMESPGRVEFGWLPAAKERGAGPSTEWATVAGTPRGTARLFPLESQEAFITEHYWGYTRQRNGSTLEYEVAHPRWKLWPVDSPALSEAAVHFYGPAFTEVLRSPPSSEFLAVGSPVVVYLPRRL